MRLVAENLPLRGKNKPSWLDDNLNNLPDTENYEKYNLWHYHCGEYPKTNKFNAVKSLRLNLTGETSSAVIHYQKVTEKHIFILAYSPNHQPFPKEQDIPNPLLNRIE